MDDTVSTRRKQLSKKEKREIIRRHYDKEQSFIRIARHFGRNEKTIARIIRKYEYENGNINRKVKLSKADKKNIIGLVYDNPYISAYDIQKNLDSSVSIHTIHRYLRKNGYDSGENRKKPYRKIRK
jgi:transposase-like protein